MRKKLPSEARAAESRALAAIAAITADVVEIDLESRSRTRIRTTAATPMAPSPARPRSGSTPRAGGSAAAAAACPTDPIRSARYRHVREHLIEAALPGAALRVPAQRQAARHAAAWQPVVRDQRRDARASASAPRAVLFRKTVTAVSTASTTMLGRHLERHAGRRHPVHGQGQHAIDRAARELGVQRRRAAGAADR